MLVNWIDAGCNERSSGLLTLAAYSSGLERDDFVQPGGYGVLATVVFDSVDVSENPVRIMSVKDDLAGFGIE